MSYLRKYADGTNATVRVQLVSPTTGRFIDGGDWTPASGDVMISIDGGTPAALDSEPAYSDGAWEFVFLNAEVTGKRVLVVIVDQDGPAVLDDSFEIETFGHASACYPPDYSTGTVPAGAITEAAFDDDTAKYQAKVWLDVDAGAGTPTDRYVVAWFKNGQPVLASITDAKIRVYLISDGSDLIALSAMTEIGTEEVYKYLATTTERITAGVGYVAYVEATIDSATRKWVQPVSRDTAT